MNITNDKSSILLVRKAFYSTFSNKRILIISLPITLIFCIFVLIYFPDQKYPAVTVPLLPIIYLLGISLVISPLVLTKWRIKDGHIKEYKSFGKLFIPGEKITINSKSTIKTEYVEELEGYYALIILNEAMDKRQITNQIIVKESEYPRNIVLKSINANIKN